VPNYRVYTDQPSDLKTLVYGNSGGANKVLLVDGTGALAIYAGSGSLTIAATDLDVRDLSATSDNILVYGQDGTSTKRIVLTDTGGALAVQDNGGAITVDASDLDIRDLTATSDNILVYGQDGTSTKRIVLTDTNGNVQIMHQRRATTDTNEVVSTVTAYSGTTARDISEQIETTFAVLNSGETSGAVVKLQISPNNSDWIDDSSETTLAPTGLTAVNPSKFLRYVRIAHKSQTAGSDTSLTVWYQAHV